MLLVNYIKREKQLLARIHHVSEPAATIMTHRMRLHFTWKILEPSFEAIATKIYALFIYRRDETTSIATGIQFQFTFERSHKDWEQKL